MHAAWELLFPRSALFLLISLWKTVLDVWSIMLGNENILIYQFFNKIDAYRQLILPALYRYSPALLGVKTLE
jgi:hypothetical protein